MQDAIRGISAAYHPVDLETGKLRDTQTVANSLNQCFYEIETVACQAQLSDASFIRITKTRKVVVDMIGTMAFFIFTIRAKIEALCLSPIVEVAVLEKLIPALYIRRTADKAATAEVRHRLRAKSDEMFKLLNSDNTPFSELAEDERVVIERVALECSGLFQRSSSCVEGRNGQLSLRHHGLHRMSDRKLSALTAVHIFSLIAGMGQQPRNASLAQSQENCFRFCWIRWIFQEDRQRNTMHQKRNYLSLLVLRQLVETMIKAYGYYYYYYY